MKEELCGRKESVSVGGLYDTTVMGSGAPAPLGAFQDPFLSSLRPLVRIFGNNVGPISAGCKQTFTVLCRCVDLKGTLVLNLQRGMRV